MKGREGIWIPTFSVLLLTAVIAFLGVVSIPMLNVRYSPESTGNSINVSFSWNGASPRIMESEVTSKIEGVLSGIKSNSGISSTSNRDNGSVRVSFRKGTDMAAARFEVASRIRNLYPKLPDGVSYPSISLGTRGTGGTTAVTFVLKSELPSKEIEKFVTARLMTPLSRIDGVEKVSFWGASPFEWVVTFDRQKADAVGIDAAAIASAFKSYFNTEMIGLANTDEGVVSVRLASMSGDDFGAIPVVNRNGRVVYLGEIADFRYQESQPRSYHRINGLNTISLSVSVEPDTNLLRLASEIRAKMNELEASFPEEITVSVSRDASEYISEELDKIYFRTLMCVLILLVFVFAVSRSWRYLLVITLTLAANILSAIVLYNVFDVAVHIYTLAGITVSLGIIIDTSIVMADHYSYYGNRSVFPALFGATATTVGALCVILLLPEQDRKNLTDFSRVIMINLTVSMATAYFFIPSLVDRFPLKKTAYSLSMKRRRRVVRWNRIYERFILMGLRRRWVFVVALVAAIGIPTCLLPDRIGSPDPNSIQKLYNRIMEWRPYADNRKEVDGILGTSFAMFNQAMDKSDFYREPGRESLQIDAGMPEGCTVGQLNEVVRSMENYLSMFDQIERFTTDVRSYDNASISVWFKPEYENTSFPAQLKANVITMASNFGGATWRVYGVNNNYFNNNVLSDYKANVISLKGYNYDELLVYADTLMDILSANRRVSGLEFVTPSGRLPVNEYNMAYDFSKMAVAGVNPYRYYSELSTVLYSRGLTSVMEDGEMTSVVLKSSEAESFDLWNVVNSQVKVDSIYAKLSELGSVKKMRTGFPIVRNNQSYEVKVGFDFIGSYELSRSFIDKTVRYMNNEVLTMGYKASTRKGGGWLSGKKSKYGWLIVLVIAVIFVTCSIIFNSLRLPLSIILMIPVSFVGVFLMFGLSDFTFDQGGFAAFVMLCGVVVNARIYLLDTFRKDLSGRSDVRKYIRAFNHKMNPIMLTVISTVLGLVPFLFDGPEEVFWFAFAVGTIAGMFFSLIALVVCLPVFCLKKL